MTEVTETARIERKIADGIAVLKEYREDAVPIIIFDVERNGKVAETGRYKLASSFRLTTAEKAILMPPPPEVAEEEQI